MLGRGWLCIKLEPGPLRSFNFEFFWKGDFNWQIGVLFSWKGDFNWQIGVFSLERASLITKLGYFSLERTALIGKLGYFFLERAALIGKLKNFSLERVTLKKNIGKLGYFSLERRALISKFGCFSLKRTALIGKLAYFCSNLGLGLSLQTSRNFRWLSGLSRASLQILPNSRSFSFDAGKDIKYGSPLKDWIKYGEDRHYSFPEIIKWIYSLMTKTKKGL